MNTLTVFPRKSNFAPIGFNNLLNDFFGEDFFHDFKSNMPLVNIKESVNGYHLEVAAPGLQKENFNITIDKNLLTISAETQTEQKQADEKYTRKEFHFSSFKRSFTLPDSIDAENIKANYESGILKIDLLKKVEIKNEVKKVVVN